MGSARLYGWALRVVTLTGLGLVLLAAGRFATLPTMTMAPPEPDRWHNYVCAGKDSGATPAEVAEWLTRQMHLDPRAAVQHTGRVWPSC